MSDADEDTGGHEPSPLGVMAALQAGLVALLSQLGDDIDQFHVAVKKTLAETLVAHGYADWARSFHQRMEDPLTPLNGAPTDIGTAVGRAVGRFCGSNPEEARLRVARHILELMPECHAAFEGAARSALRQTPHALLTLVSTLRTRAADSADEPRLVAEIRLRDIEALKTARTASSRLQDVWEGRPYIPMCIVYDHWAFELLRRLDLPAYLQVLGELPYAEFARQIIGHEAWTATADELVELVSLAPAALDDAGVLTECIPLDILVLATCVKRWFGEEQYHPQSPRNVLVKGEATFEAEGARVVKALTGRRNCQALGYAWLQYLIGTARSRGARRVGSDERPAAERWLALIRKVAGALPLHPTPCEWIRGEQPLWRNERIYALLAVLVSNQPADADRIAGLLRTCLSQGIVTTHAIQEFQFDHQPCNFSIVALAVAAIQDLAGWFKDLWGSIYLQRERTRHGRGDPNGDVENVGLVAVFWTFAGLAQLPVGSPASRSLWVELEVAVREGALTDAFSTETDAWNIAARLVAAYWTLLFTDDPVRGMPGSLDEFLLNWAEADGDFALLVAELASRGVTAEKLSRSIDGDLVRAAWQDAIYLNQRIQKTLPAFDLEGLAAAIDTQRQPVPEV